MTAPPVAAHGVWRDVVGQPETIAALERAVTDPASMTHAWLFTGPPGSGRSVAARAFAGALQCPDGGCGECRECRLALGTGLGRVPGRGRGGGGAWRLTLARLGRQ